MEQLLTFIANHPILFGAFAVVLAALIATEFARLTRRWKELEPTQAILLINRRDPLILDVSNSTDYANGHILNAEHMPPSRIESGNSALLKKLDRPVLVYCKNGQVSPQMATRLVKLGFEDVNLLRGGLSQWISDKQPVTRGKPGKQSKPKGSGGKKSSGKASAGKGAAGKGAAGKRGKQGNQSKADKPSESQSAEAGDKGAAETRQE